MYDEMPWGARGEGYVVLQFILFIIIFLIPFVGPNLARWPAPWGMIGSIVGLALGLAGFALAMTGLINLGRNLTAVPHPKDNATFVEKGVYRFVRHPIYSGIILGSIGWAFFMNNYLLFLLCIALFLFFDIKTRREEKWLRAKFAEYAGYQQRVKKLIPLIY